MSHKDSVPGHGHVRWRTTQRVASTRSAARPIRIVPSAPWKSQRRSVGWLFTQRAFLANSHLVGSIPATATKVAAIAVTVRPVTAPRNVPRTRANSVHAASVKPVALKRPDCH